MWQPPGASADSERVVFRGGGLRVTYHTSRLGDSSTYENVSKRARLRYACTFATSLGLGEDGGKLRPRHHRFEPFVWGGRFTWIKCVVERRRWPQLKPDFTHGRWWNDSIELLYFRNHVYIFNRTHTQVSRASCSWTTGGGGTVYSYPSALPLAPYDDVRVASPEPDTGSMGC
jgi:hypothetical protein